MSRGWDCEAYGPDLPGEMCFFEATSRCGTEGECRDRMAGERQRVFRRIQELGAHGDPVWADLSEDFANPDELLNADRPDGPGVPEQ